MKLLINSSLLLFVILLFSGCLEVRTTVNVNKDGSGTLNEKVLFSKDMVELLSSFNVSDTTDSTGSSKFSFVDEKELKSRAAEMGEGVEYVSSKDIKEDGREGYCVVYSFNDLSKLKINENPNNKMNLSETDSGNNEKKEYLTFNFKQGNPAEILVNMSKRNLNVPSEDKKSSRDTVGADNPFAKQFLNMMKDFRISIGLHINGKIESTNASYVEGSNITLFDVAFKELFKDKDKLDEFSRMKDHSISELKEVLKNIPGIKLELNNPVLIKFD